MLSLLLVDLHHAIVILLSYGWAILCMSGSFDIDNLKNAAYTVGYMDQRVIETLGLSIKPGPIKISRSRIRHTKKHEIDFPNRSVYKLSVESIPDIYRNS